MNEDIDRMRHEGIVGNKKLQEGDVVLHDPISVKLEHDHSMCAYPTVSMRFTVLILTRILQEIEIANV